ncbi:MAG: neuraminidase-like domain-containing protein [bacterium]
MSTIKISDPNLDSFYGQNPNFDILNFDFYNPSELSQLKTKLQTANVGVNQADGEETITALKAYQRLLRVNPNVNIVRTLLENGIDSAHKITTLSQTQFIKEYGPKFGENGVAKAKQVYLAAANAKSQVMHLFANIASLVGSRHFRSMNVNHVSENIPTYFESLSSYQEIFGSLNYCECSECQSIFGPAAYLVDLLRIIDKAITVPNTTKVKLEDNIPDGLKLFDRRPDLAKIQLTCANTNNTVPYLQIVNQILEQTVGNAFQKEGKLLNNNVFLTLAQTYYPFNLPFNLPLQQIRTYLNNQKIDLSDIYQALNPTDFPSHEYLGLSIEQYNNLKPTNDSNKVPDIVSKNYGLTITSSDLAGLDRLDKDTEKTGEQPKPNFIAQTRLSRQQVESLFSQNLSIQELFDVSGEYNLSGKGTKLTLKQVSDRVTGNYDLNNGELQGTLKRDESRNQWIFRGHWLEGTKQPPDGAGRFEFTFDLNGSGFTGQWSKGYGGNWEANAWNGTRDDSTPAIGGIIPHHFFINKVLADQQYLNISINTSDPNNQYEQINNLSLATLDVINRFVRLAQALGWSYSDLDWVLTSLSATEIDDTTLSKLAKIKKLSDKYNLPLDSLTALWFDIKTIGIGNGEYSEAPFDVIFNNPDLIKNSAYNSSYHPQIETATTGYVNPLYQDKDVLDWIVSNTQFEKFKKEKLQANQAGDIPSDITLERANVIVASIPASGDDIKTVAIAALGELASIKLSLPNLSLLYRHTILPKQLGMRVPEYVLLLHLLGMTQKITISGKEVIVINPILTPDDVLRVAESVDWIRDSGLTIYDIDYICNKTPNDQTPSVYVNTGYDPQNILAFLKSLQPLINASLLQKDDFVSKEITQAASKAYYEILLQQGFINNLGLIVKTITKTEKPDFSIVSQIAPGIANPNEDQINYICSKVIKQQQEQLEHFAEQLGSFFGVKGELMAVLIDGVKNWLTKSNLLADFLWTVLFDIIASDVLMGEAVDGTKLQTVFKNNKIELSSHLQITPQTTICWKITDATNNRNYYAYTKTFTQIDFHQENNQQILFSSNRDDVISNGDLDLSKLPALFKKNGSDLSANPTVEVIQKANSWTIQDVDNNCIYYAYKNTTDQITFYKPIETGKDATIPEIVTTFLRSISQYFVLQQKLGLSIAELSSVFQYPQTYGINTDNKPVKLALSNVRDIYYLKKLIVAFGDRKNALVNYFTKVFDNNPPANDMLMTQLYAITGWNQEQCGYLCQKLFSAPGTCKTVEGIFQLKQVFDIGNVLGVDIYFLEKLSQVARVEMTNDNWQTYTNLARQLLQSVKAKTTSEAWPTTYKQLNDPLEEQKRNALLNLAIWQLGKQYKDITDPRKLYEYLLIDVEMGGCAEISYIKEALNAAQLYLQRCRLNLERNVTISTDDLPNVWWEWLMNYRIWEANRQIFLYPENYIDPTLRKSKTSLFRELENTLLQGEVTKEKVEEAYKTYLDKFAQLAKLKYVDAYHATVHNKEKGAIDTLFLFARTQEEPYNFYYIAREKAANCDNQDAYLWTEWQKIDITINAKTITPVYAFNKLFVFWVEIKKVRDKDQSGSSGSDAEKVIGLYKDVYKATIKYSFYNFSGNWVQPQILVNDKVIDIESSTNIYGPFDPNLFDTENPFWHKVAALTIVPNSYPANNQSHDVTEKISLFYGPLINALDETRQSNNPSSKQKTDGDDIADFKEIIIDSDEKWNQMKAAEQSGYFPIQPFITLNSEMEEAFLLNHQEYILLESNPSGDKNPPTFKVGILGTSLVINATDNPLYENYIDGMGLEKVVINPPHTPVLFTNVARKNTVIVPVKNQPGWFLFSNKSETFLISSTSQYLDTKQTPIVGTFQKFTEALTLEEPYGFVRSDSFVDVGGIDPKIIFDTLLSQDLIESRKVGDQDEGLIDIGKTKEQISADIIKIAIPQLSLEQAQQVKDIMLASRPTGLSYASSNFTSKDNVNTLKFTTERITTSAIYNLSRVLFTEGIDGLLSLCSQQAPENIKLPFERLKPSAVVTPPDLTFGDQVSFSGPYGNYFWELFFHGPMLVANMLNNNQQFREAERWLQYIFNPTLNPIVVTPDSFVTDDISKEESETIFGYLQNKQLGEFINDQGEVTELAKVLGLDGIISATQLDSHRAQEVLNILLNKYLETPTTRYWQFLPFRNHTLESLKDQLQNCSEIAAYNNDPFDPHAIARLRIGAYEKAVVMKYIDNLLDWGDYEFAQYTWESITAATMLYVYAYDLLGPKPVALGSCEEQFPVTFTDIQAEYLNSKGGIPQFLIDMEHFVGNGGAATNQVGKAFNELDIYFCVPENEQFTAYWDRVQDRLYKIRHCLNIKGQKQPLPLFQPPIDPMALVRAAAADNNVLDVATQLQPNIPNYRFSYMIERAKNITSTVIQFGQSLLSALEKNDAEALALLYSSQSGVILTMTTMVKQKQIEELQDQLAALQQNLQSAQYRYDHYKTLISNGINAAESANLLLSAEVLPLKLGVIGFHGISIGGYVAPVVFGFSDGDMKLGDAIQMGAQISNTIAEMLQQSAAIAAIVGEQQRRQEEWEFQQQLAQYDVDQIKQQIEANKVNIAISQQELAIHKKQIEQSDQQENFLKSKFTNQELYQWMISRLSTVYFQTYRVALEMALAAQTAYYYELERDDQYITFSYWDSLHKGLLAGEGLMYSLLQLENAYVENNVRRLEIEKTISLRQQFPEAFVGFKWGNLYGDDKAQKGQLQFTLSQQLFDFDFPSHYCRKIKSISISIPAVIGPYQNINATLTQNSNVVVLKPDKNAVDYLLKKMMPELNKKTNKNSGSSGNISPPPSGTVRENWVPNQQIAISTGIDDTGMFALNFEDERYLPFEGTGAVSSWTLNMPPETNRINFDSLSDVIVKVRYTAKDGGSNSYGTDVKNLYKGAGIEYQNLKAKSIELNQAFASSWYQMFNTLPVNNQQKISFPITDDIILPNLEGVKLQAVLLQLEVANAGEVKGIGNDAFITLEVGQVTKGSPSPFSKSFDITNNFGELTADDLSSLTTWKGNSTQWSLNFDVSKPAASALVTSKTLRDGSILSSLDSTKLLNVALIIVYSAKPF